MCFSDPDEKINFMFFLGLCYVFQSFSYNPDTLKKFGHNKIMTKSDWDQS
jgi:hypothetical protein